MVDKVSCPNFLPPKVYVILCIVGSDLCQCVLLNHLHEYSIIQHLAKKTEAILNLSNGGN